MNDPRRKTCATLGPMTRSDIIKAINTAPDGSVVIIEEPPPKPAQPAKKWGGIDGIK